MVVPYSFRSFKSPTELVKQFLDLIAKITELHFNGGILQKLADLTGHRPHIA
jgi:hypothetical protein